MVKLIWAACMAAAVSGCAATDGERWWRRISGQAPAAATYHFDWQLSGDPDPAPLQVFDDGRDTWLQYPAGQAVPALFARSSDGDRLLRARRAGDFLVVSGVPDHLLMRGGLLQAEARRRPAMAAGGAAAPLPAAAASPQAARLAPSSAAAAVHPGADAGLPGTAAVQVPAPIPVPASARGPGFAPTPAPASASVSPSASRAVSGSLPPRAASAGGMAVSPVVAAPGRPASAPGARRPPSGAASKPPGPMFEVTPADGNVRRALGRWARTAGWTFEADHWAVDVDIPLAGSAVFDAPFRAAVRGLLAATELGDRPLQPCFYANQVLRVVPLAQRCDRTQEPRAAS